MNPRTNRPAPHRAVAPAIRRGPPPPARTLALVFLLIAAPGLLSGEPAGPGLQILGVSSQSSGELPAPSPSPGPDLDCAMIYITKKEHLLGGDPDPEWIVATDAPDDRDGRAMVTAVLRRLDAWSVETTGRPVRWELPPRHLDPAQLENLVRRAEMVKLIGRKADELGREPFMNQIRYSLEFLLGYTGGVLEGARDLGETVGVTAADLLMLDAWYEIGRGFWDLVGVRDTGPNPFVRPIQEKSLADLRKLEAAWACLEGWTGRVLDDPWGTFLDIPVETLTTIYGADTPVDQGLAAGGAAFDLVLTVEAVTSLPALARGATKLAGRTFRGLGSLGRAAIRAGKALAVDLGRIRTRIRLVPLRLASRFAAEGLEIVPLSLEARVGTLGQVTALFREEAGFLAVLAGEDPLLAKMARWTRTERGVYQVIIHGAEGSGSLAVQLGGRWVLLEPRELAAFMRAYGYDGGPVRLYSCHAGGGAAGTARRLARELRTRVSAPTGEVVIAADGTVTLRPLADGTPGRWVEFDFTGSMP